MTDQLYTDPRRYGLVKFTTIQATKNALREAIQEEGTERIQGLWDRLEQWIDSPPMMPKKETRLNQQVSFGRESEVKL